VGGDEGVIRNSTYCIGFDAPEKDECPAGRHIGRVGTVARRSKPHPRWSKPSEAPVARESAPPSKGSPQVGGCGVQPASIRSSAVRARNRRLVVTAMPDGTGGSRAGCQLVRGATVVPNSACSMVCEWQSFDTSRRHQKCLSLGA
jgi:hypothetical protein